MREKGRGTGLSPLGQLCLGSERRAGSAACQKSLGSLTHQSAAMLAEPWLCRKRKEQHRVFFTLLSSLKRLKLRNQVGCLAIDLEIKPCFCTSHGVCAHVQCLASLLEQCSDCATAPEIPLQLLALDCQTWTWATVQLQSSLVFGVMPQVSFRSYR